MTKTTYKIAKMDCAAEENIVRMKLEGLQNIAAVQFDVPKRKLIVIDGDNAEQITTAINSLNFNSSVLESEKIENDEALLFTEITVQERRLLKQVFAINFFFFAFEMITGFISRSMGLVADSLDMFADPVVYGLALFVVGRALSQKRKIARIAGYLQLLLTVFGVVEVITRFLRHGETSDFKTMIAVSLLALTSNAITLYLLQKSKSKEAYIQASMIFTSTDVIVNIGVIVAAALVYFTSSNLPDLIVGRIVFVLVGISSYRILRL